MKGLRNELLQRLFHTLATYTTIGTLGYKDVKVVNNVGTAKLALDYDNAKVNANTLEVTVSGEGYYGTKTVTVTGN